MAHEEKELRRWNCIKGNPNGKKRRTGFGEGEEWIKKNKLDTIYNWRNETFKR